ncbi:MAG TPA: toprim domain-containing protein [Nitrososphaeraceae archaeon]|nr:toprim domain-containing protein [Nitrososphaeraceae archaeon]
MLNLVILNNVRRMGYKQMDAATIGRLHHFVEMLNKEAENGSVIVVEGKRDVEALVRVGFNGEVTVFNRYKGINDFVDSHYWIERKIILLLDMDRTGKCLTSKLLKQLQCKGKNVSLFYKKTLVKISYGKIRHVEDLISYAPQLSGITSSRKDLYFYL